MSGSRHYERVLAGLARAAASASSRLTPGKLRRSGRCVPRVPAFVGFLARSALEWGL